MNGTYTPQRLEAALDIRSSGCPRFYSRWSAAKRPGRVVSRRPVSVVPGDGVPEKDVLHFRATADVVHDERRARRRPFRRNSVADPDMV
jgi:hypothetical protein